MSDTGGRDERRDAFLELSTTVLVVNVVLILWLGSGERGYVNTFLVLLGALLAGWLGSTAVVSKRLPRRSSRSQRQPWRRDLDQLAGLIVIVAIGVLNLTWYQWLPGVGSYPDVPLSRLPDSFEALRLGLTVIVAASLTVAIVVALRLALPRKPLAETAIVGAPGRGVS